MRIRAWIIRLLQGQAPTTPPDSNGHNREDHPDRRPRVEIICPECSATIPVSIESSIETLPCGDHELTLTPDMTDLWAHSFTHEQETP